MNRADRRRMKRAGVIPAREAQDRMKEAAELRRRADEYGTVLVMGYDEPYTTADVKAAASTAWAEGYLARVVDERMR